MVDAPPTPAGKPSSNSSLRQTLLIALAVVILGALAWRASGAIQLEGFSWQRLGEVIRGTNLWLLAVALAAIYAAYAIRAWRWMRLSRYVGRSSFWNVYPATLIGFAVVFLLGRAGEPVRPILIARKDRIPVSSAFGVYVMERIFDVASTAVIAGFALLVFPETPGGTESSALLAAARTTGVLLLVGLIAAISFLVYFRLHGASALERRMARWRQQHGWRAKVAGLFSGFVEGLHGIRTLGDLMAAIGSSSAHWILVAYIYLWVFHAFGGRLGELDFVAAMLVLAFTMVGSTLQLPGVGGGSQVASFLALTVVFGVEKEAAAASSIVLWLITFAGSCLAGVPLLVKEGWSMAELRRLASAEAEAEAAGTHVRLPESAPVATHKESAK